MKNLASRKGTRQRSRSGTTLVEILVALLVGSLFAGLFLDLVGQLMRLRVASQNEVCANAIAQEMLENTQALGYSYLSKNQGSYELLTHLTPTTTVAPQNIKPTPAQLDFVNKFWSPTSVQTKFQGHATYSVQPAPGLINALQVKVTIKWFDGHHIQGRPVTATTIVTKSGLNKWAQ